MTTLDFLTGIVLLGFIGGGYTSGLIQSAGSLVGLLLGFTLANRFYISLSGIVAPFVGGQGNVAKVVTYALILIIISRLFGVLVALLLKVFKILTMVPGLKMLDKIGGTALGFLEGALVLGLVYGIGKNLFGDTFQHQLDLSPLSRFVVQVGAILLPLVPKALKSAEQLTPNINVDAGTLVNGAVNAVRDNPETMEGAAQQLINSGVYR